MALETGTYISDLVTTNPPNTDGVAQADDHLRLIKSTVKATFPNITGAVTPTHTELNYVDGVTSALQTQLDAKQPLDADLTAIGALAGTSGLLRKTAANTWSLETASYAPLANPTFTGVPAAPTASADTNTTQLATTAYVVGQGYLKSSTASTTYQTALGFTPVQQGGGTSQLSNKVYIGWDNANLRVQVDSTDFGASWPINISGTAAAPSSAAVLGATAAAAVGAVGTYAFLRSVASTAYNQGDTVAGSLLSYTNGNGGGGNPSPAGSWRLMGSTGTQTNSALASLWLRYA